MRQFESVRDVRRWATTCLAAVAFVLVAFDDSLWAFEVYPDGHVFPLRVVRCSGVYS